MTFSMARPKYVVVDTNVWVALHHEDDALHNKARQLFAQFDERGVTAVVTDYIIQEVFSVTSRVSNQEDAMAFYDYIVGLKRVETIDVNSFLLRRVVQFIRVRGLTKPLGLIDYSIIFFAEFVDCPIASFDKQLVQSAKKLGVMTW